MRFVTDLSAEQIDEFVLHHPYSHYMKCSFWGEYKQKTEGYQLRYAGVKDEQDQLLATAVLLKKREWFSLKPYLYIPTGMCVDYRDSELLHFFVDELIQYAKKEKVAFLRIDPNVLRCHRDILGNQIEDGFDNEAITQYFLERGFFHKGYGYAYNGSWINRFTLKVDLSLEFEEIVRKFNKSKQNVLKRQDKMGITTRYGKREELSYLVDFEWDLTKTQGFKPHKVSFFEELIDTLKDHICFYVTEVDLNQNIAYLEEELISNKYKKDPEAKASKEKEYEEAKKLKEIYGDKPVIAAGVFVRYGNNSWDLYTYNRKVFSNYKATDNLHRFVMKDMKDHGVTVYDMVGFSGVTKKSDPYYGLYDYKRSFGSDFYEHIGEFDYIIDEKETKRFKYLLYQIKRVRRKYFSIRYKEKK